MRAERVWPSLAEEPTMLRDVEPAKLRRASDQVCDRAAAVPVLVSLDRHSHQSTGHIRVPAACALPHPASGLLGPASRLHDCTLRSGQCHRRTGRRVVGRPGRSSHDDALRSHHRSDRHGCAWARGGSSDCGCVYVRSRPVRRLSPSSHAGYGCRPRGARGSRPGVRPCLLGPQPRLCSRSDAGGLHSCSPGAPRSSVWALA
jgi:hypothetical protein